MNYERPNKVTTEGVGFAPLFHAERQRPGASEFLRYAERENKPDRRKYE